MGTWHRRSSTSTLTKRTPFTYEIRCKRRSVRVERNRRALRREPQGRKVTWKDRIHQWTKPERKHQETVFPMLKTVCIAENRCMKSTPHLPHYSLRHTPSHSSTKHNMYYQHSSNTNVNTSVNSIVNQVHVKQSRSSLIVTGIQVIVFALSTEWSH